MTQESESETTGPTGGSTDSPSAPLNPNPNPPYYGTFQGVTNYYPPASQPPYQPVVGLPRPISPPASFVNYRYQDYAVVEGRPVRQRRLPCCGIGLGWFLFITGFFFGGFPWYVGAFLVLFVQMDYREKPGLVACMVATILAILALTLGLTKRNHAW